MKSHMQTPVNNNSAKDWENRATHILQIVRCFVDALRSAPSLDVTSSQLQQSTAGISKNNKSLYNSSDGSLVKHLEFHNVINQVKVMMEFECCPQTQPSSEIIDVAPCQTRPIKTEDNIFANHFQTQDNSHYNDERKQILYQIIFPLLKSLEECYEVLDNLPTEAESYSNSSDKRKKNKKNKAPPPLGMLSLIDYTNVACLLEFAISISLVPCLEYPDIYLPPLSKSSSTDMQMHNITSKTTIISQKRNQSLPKSLAGRISKPALTWGTTCMAEHHNLLCDNRLLSSCNNKTTTLQLYHIYNIFQSYNEFVTLACLVGKLLLLDRFRPMLLPRHLSDVYLSLFIAERLRWYLSKLDKQYQEVTKDNSSISEVEQMIETERAIERSNCHQLHTLHMALLLSPLAFPSSFISSPNLSPSSSSLSTVGYREAALAFRNLLGGGACMIMVSNVPSPAIPSWLRLRLGQCLTKLAQTDIQAVVDVFVACAGGPGGESSTSGDDILTGAAARLANALCAKPTSLPSNTTTSKDNAATRFQQQLCTQFVQFLVIEGEHFVTGLRTNDGNDIIQSRSSMAMNFTLWATIAQLPIETIQSYFTAEMIKGLVPSSLDEDTILLSTFQSVAAIVAWLSSAPSSLDPSTKKKLQSMLFEPSYSSQQSKDCSITILNQVLRLLASFATDTTTSGSNLIVEIDNEESEENNVFSRLAETTMAQIILILLCVDQLTEISLELVRAVSTNDLDKKGYHFDKTNMKVYRRNPVTSGEIDMPHLIEGIETRTKCLIRTIISLSEVIEGTEDSGSQVGLLLSTLFRTVLLLHYSNISGSDSGNNTSVLDTLDPKQKLNVINKDELKITATVILATLCESCSPSILLGSSQCSNTEGSDSSVLQLLGLIVKSAADRVEEEDHQTEDSVELFSTTSIILSLLIAVLELGLEKRSDDDESLFKSILPSLRVLCSGENGSLAPELAEMSSHAMALIAARGSRDLRDKVVQKEPSSTKMSRMDIILEKLSQCQTDLQSSQPPLRAKGVVTLRHIARSLVDDAATDDNETNKPIILDVSGTEEATTTLLSAKEELVLISRTLTKICLDALADGESYVYLAAIQTIVAISDVCPFEIMSLVGAVIARGTVNIKVGTTSTTIITLAPGQRIKATDSLIFMIRRRGDAIFAYGPSLLEIMLYGHPKKKHNKCIDEQVSHLIQTQTHTYFTGENYSEENEDSDKDEKLIRLKTGGPVYLNEENELLRAGAISVVCELVSVLPAITVASYCQSLVTLVMDALQLESSRPVRRAVACLARELYDCVMTEVTDQSEGDCTSKMAIAIANADEEKLYNLLARCVSADDVDIQSRLADPATQSRCAEAIEIRLELEDMGVLQAATFIARSLDEDMNNPIVQVVRRSLSK